MPAPSSRSWHAQPGGGHAGETLAGELGFVILHRCGESFYFLLIASWRNENELWETVWAKNGEGATGLRAVAVEGPHRPAFCVWELARGVPRAGRLDALPAFGARRGAKQHYLEDTYSGFA